MSRQLEKARSLRETAAQEHLRLRSEGIVAAQDLWQRDPVSAYLSWAREGSKKRRKFLSAADRTRSQAHFAALQKFIGDDPRRIETEDTRLNHAERRDVISRKKAYFRNAAFRYAPRGGDDVETDKSPLTWSIVDMLFSYLETAFDLQFHHTGVGQTTGESGADNQRKVDAILAGRQRDLANALWDCDSALAKSYAEVLRTALMSPSLSDVERRTPFRKQIELRDIEKSISRVSAPPSHALPFEESAPVSKRFGAVDAEWRVVMVDDRVFKLKNRNQIKKVLRFLVDGGFTSHTGRRAPVADVCRAAGQNAKEPNLHAIFHVPGKPASPEVDYDQLYDLVIDSPRGKGVWLKV